ncbi:hypothetical protein [Algibacter sp.]
MEPQPLSITAKGGQIMDNKTLKKLIYDLLDTETSSAYIDDLLI